MSDTPFLSLPADYAMLTKLRAFIREQAIAMGLSTDAVDALSLAVDEAATNIISHVAKGMPHAIECKCCIDTATHELVCELIYEADTLFAPESTPAEEDIFARVRAMKRGGLGVYLVHKLVDKVEYRRDGERNVICLIMHV